MSVEPSDIKSLFISKGGEFVISASEIKLKLGNTQAFIFDWDGVFNDGTKVDTNGSPFNEIDSMGLNMLRFSYFLKFGFIPKIFIVTGENNQPALQLSKREHFNGVYLKMPNKLIAMEHIKNEYKVKKENSAFVFDDILDLGLADAVGLRFYVKRDVNSLLNKFISDHNLADYDTGFSGSNNAVREVCELCIGLMENFNEVVEHRVKFSDEYQEYLSLRNEEETSYYTLKDGKIANYSPV